MFNNADLVASLTNVANMFVTKMRQRLDAGRYPKGDAERGIVSIQDATRIGEAKTTDTGASIDVIIDTKKAPYAGAYEWGSGVHGEEGATYVIAPKEKKALAFFWPEADFSSLNPSKKFIGISETTGKYLFKYVDHPGVEGKPYIQPTIDENMEEMKKILGESFKVAILRGMPKLEIIEC